MAPRRRLRRHYAPWQRMPRGNLCRIILDVVPCPPVKPLLWRRLASKQNWRLAWRCNRQDQTAPILATLCGEDENALFS